MPSERLLTLEPTRNTRRFFSSLLGKSGSAPEIGPTASPRGGGLEPFCGARFYVEPLFAQVLQNPGSLNFSLERLDGPLKSVSLTQPYLCHVLPVSPMKIRKFKCHHEPSRGGSN